MMESLTSTLADEAEAIIAEVEGLGGMAAAVAAGMPKQRIEQAATRKQARRLGDSSRRAVSANDLGEFRRRISQARIDSASDAIVGVNKFVPEAGREQPAPELRVIDNSAVRLLSLLVLSAGAVGDSSRNSPAGARGAGGIARKAARDAR